MAGQTTYVWCRVHPMNTTLIIIPQVAAPGNVSGSQLELDQFVIPLPKIIFFSHDCYRICFVCKVLFQNPAGKKINK